MYTDHFLRKFVRKRSPEIMPTINGFFTDPNQNSMLPMKCKLRLNLGILTSDFSSMVTNCDC
ncbi:hypothetical protein ACSBR2_023992 [Camellia fascicularis]